MPSTTEVVRLHTCFLPSIPGSKASHVMQRLAKCSCHVHPNPLTQITHLLSVFVFSFRREAASAARPRWHWRQMSYSSK